VNFAAAKIFGTPYGLQIAEARRSNNLRRIPIENELKTRKHQSYKRYQKRWLRSTLDVPQNLVLSRERGSLIIVKHFIPQIRTDSAELTREVSYNCEEIMSLWYWFMILTTILLRTVWMRHRPMIQLFVSYYRDPSSRAADDWTINFNKKSVREE